MSMRRSHEMTEISGTHRLVPGRTARHTITLDRPHTRQPARLQLPRSPGTARQHAAHNRSGTWKTRRAAATKTPAEARSPAASRSGDRSHHTEPVIEEQNAEEAGLSPASSAGQLQ